MSAALRRLASEPNANIALKAYLDFCNYAIPGLMDEAAIAERILKTMQEPGLKHREMREAIQKGFAAARIKPQLEASPGPQGFADTAETEIPLPPSGLAEARVIARSRRSLWAIRLGFTSGDRS